MSIEKLNDCIKHKKANTSRAREAIYNLLLDSEECLNVSQILKKLLIAYPKKISQNTLYRHLSFFVDCKLVVVVQDDFKRAYYSIKENKVMSLCICTNCNNVTKISLGIAISDDELSSAEFITVHKLCSKCN